MEAAAPCSPLLMNVLILLFAQQSHTCDAAATLRVVPSSVQLFRYEPVSFVCEGLNVSAAWTVRTAKDFMKKCSYNEVTSAVNCTVRSLETDSGKYWCEGGGQRSNAVNITVTGGPVVLESPVLPVMEGGAVTLRCRATTTSLNTTADFSKDGVHIMRSSTGHMTIHSVSKSDEGLYRCRTSGAESAESWLAVRGRQAEDCCPGAAVILESPARPVTKGEAVTLRCRDTNTFSDVKADFYKDGRLVGNSSTGEMTIHGVSKPDEGLYKCHISGVGESAESWLSVRDKDLLSLHHYRLLLWIFIVVILAVELLLIGLLHWLKQLVLLEAETNDPNNELHDGVRKDQKSTNKDETSAPSLHSSFSSDDPSQDQHGLSSFVGSAAPETSEYSIIPLM